MIAQVQADYEAQSPDLLQLDRLAEISHKLDEVIDLLSSIWMVATFTGAFLIGDLIFRYFFKRRVDD